MKLKSETIFFIVIVLIVLLGFGFLLFGTKPKNESVDTNALVRGDSLFYGEKNAEVVLVEFGDFQCPACKSVEPILGVIREEYKDKIKFVFRHFPLSNHKNAYNAAKASEAAAQQGKFWEYHDLLYQNQDEWALESNPNEKFLSYAKKLNLDTAKFTIFVNSEGIEDKIDGDKEDGQKTGVMGTPTFFLNGEKLSGNYSKAYFQEKIEQKLADVRN